MKKPICLNLTLFQHKKLEELKEKMSLSKSEILRRWIDEKIKELQYEDSQ